MQESYRSVFYTIVKETQDRYGYDLPFDIEAYVTMLLATHIDKTSFLPENSFTESYLKLDRPYGARAKELGDTCLFTVGVFPGYGNKKGLTTYFSNVGKTSYDLARDRLNDRLFLDLRNHFDFLTNFINVCTTNDNKQQILSFINNH
tara:strand:- start:20259 stop:20699 length:441 start_codon:yes stop_codon:yes gene_type:complete